MSNLEHSIVQRASEPGRSELVVARPPAVLRPYVREYVGYREALGEPICRRELPADEVPLIVNFGAPVRLIDSQDPSRWVDLGSFTTGVYDTHVLVGTSGPSAGLQINFTIAGARLCLGPVMAAMANRALELRDLWGRDADRLTARLLEAPGWDARFAIVTRELLARFAAARPMAPEVSRVFARLRGSGGTERIAHLVRESGWSQKHLITRFRDEVGLAPKALARVIRFGRAVRAIKAGRAATLTDLALECGYYDQAHFTRDCRRLAGVPPGELVRSLLPDRGGFLVDPAPDGDPHPLGGHAR